MLQNQRTSRSLMKAHQTTYSLGNDTSNYQPTCAAYSRNQPYSLASKRTVNLV